MNQKGKLEQIALVGPLIRAGRRVKNYVQKYMPKTEGEQEPIVSQEYVIPASEINRILAELRRKSQRIRSYQQRKGSDNNAHMQSEEVPDKYLGSN